MKRLLLQGPGVEPMGLGELKAHLRVTVDDEDVGIAAIGVAARVAVENAIRRVLVAQRWRAIVESWPPSDIALPVTPVLSVEAVRAIDRSGAATELSEADYAFERAGGSVRLFTQAPDAVRYEVDFTAGYGETGADVPRPLRLALLMLAAHWFENRSAAIVGDAAQALPLGFAELAAPYRRLSLC